MNANDCSILDSPVVVQTLLGAGVLHLPQSQGLAYYLVSWLAVCDCSHRSVHRSESWYLKFGIYLQIEIYGGSVWKTLKVGNLNNTSEKRNEKNSQMKCKLRQNMKLIRIEGKNM